MFAQKFVFFYLCSDGSPAIRAGSFDPYNFAPTTDAD